MPTLPAHPNLDHLRHQAKDLLRAAQAGEADAIARIHSVSDRLTLATAQLAVAREYGFASWPKLKEEVEARTLDLAQKVDAFCAASISGNTRRAARLLAETPAIDGYSFATAVILGDADRVDGELLRDPGLATRPAHGLDCAPRRLRLTLAPTGPHPHPRSIRGRPAPPRRRRRPDRSGSWAPKPRGGVAAAALRHRRLEQRP